MAITGVPNYRAPDDKVKGEGAEILAGEILTNCDPGKQNGQLNTGSKRVLLIVF